MKRKFLLCASATVLIMAMINSKAQSDKPRQGIDERVYTDTPVCSNCLGRINPVTRRLQNDTPRIVIRNMTETDTVFHGRLVPNDSFTIRVLTADFPKRNQDSTLQIIRKGTFPKTYYPDILSFGGRKSDSTWRVFTGEEHDYTTAPDTVRYIRR